MMKKLFKLFSVLVCVILLSGCSKAIKLSDIAESINNSSTVKYYKENDIPYNASAEKNELKVVMGKDDYKVDLTFTVKNNVLSGDFKTDSNTSFSTALVVANVINSVEELLGYKKDEFAKTLNSEDITKYTLDKDGLFIDAEKENELHVKVSLTKKAPLADFSKVYLEAEDFEDIKSYIKEGSGSTSKGNVYFSSSYTGGKYTVYISEDGGLTENSYKSLLTFVDVVFGNKKASEYIKKNYTDISVGNKEFKGVNIKTNYKLEEDELTLPSDSYKVMKVVINAKDFKKSIK